MRTVENYIKGGKVIDDTLYFSERDFNGLLCYDLKSNEIVLLTHFFDEEFNRFALHKNSALYRNWLYFLPNQSAHIHAYNIVTRQQKSFLLEKKEESNTYIYDPVLLGQKLYFFSMQHEDPIYVLDLESQTLENDYRLADWYRTLGFCAEGRFGSRLCERDGFVYLVEEKKNIVYRWDMENGVGNLYETSVDNLFGVANVKGELWLYTWDAMHLYKWNEDNQIIKYVCESKGAMEKRYVHVIGVGDLLIAVPEAGGELQVLKEGATCFEEWDVLTDPKIDFKDKARFFGYDVNGTDLYLFFSVGHGFVKMDTLAMIAEWKLTVMSNQKEINKLDAMHMRFFWEREGIIYETGTQSLEGFLLLETDGKKEKTEESIGGRIYKQCM